MERPGTLVVRVDTELGEEVVLWSLGERIRIVKVEFCTTEIYLGLTLKLMTRVKENSDCFIKPKINGFYLLTSKNLVLRTKS